MWIVSLFFSIMLVICSAKAHEDWPYSTGMGAAIAGVLTLWFIYVMNMTDSLTLVDHFIQILAIVVSAAVLFNNFSSYCNFSTAFLGITLVIFCIASVCDFFTGISGKTNSENSISEMNSQNAQVETLKRGFEWDYENPEINITEYSIMGVSGKELIVTVSYNGENSLRSIPLDTVKVEFSDSALNPYVYRKNYIYTEYDYRKNPPEALRKDSETWSDYILCGTKTQIQALFGYQENFNFEQ